MMMPVTLTLKNIPDDVYERLKASAESNRRSMNSEAIVCLDAALQPGRLTTNEVLTAAREVRESFGGRLFKAEDIDTFKRAGRK
jgi:plasmid stability protein